MSSLSSTRLWALLRREVLEYRGSLLLTPLLLAAGLSLLLLLSVFVTSRLGVLDDSLVQAALQQSTGDAKVSIRIAGTPEQGRQYEYRVERPAGPIGKDGAAAVFSQEESAAREAFRAIASFNPVLRRVHALLFFVLLLVSANYLLGALFTDRRDRSILFWKSLPVSEWEEIYCKFGVVLVVAPAVYIGASLIAQIAAVAVAMLAAWHMGLGPVESVLGKIDFGSLLFHQIGTWPLLAVQLAPVYAWLLFASAAARRSPFMLAVAPLIAGIVVEKVLFGSGHLLAAASARIPRGVGSPEAFPAFIDISSVVAGLLFAAALLWVTVYLRRYRFEIQ